MDEEKKEIIIHIVDGIADVVQKPEGVTVRIRDYDTNSDNEIQEIVYPVGKIADYPDDDEISEMASDIIRGIEVSEGW